MKSGKFQYLDIDDRSAFFTISGNKHMEYHQGKKYWIKSELVWISDCAYQTTLIDFKFPDFPFKPGDKMIVEIEKVEDKIIHYKSTVNEKSWKGSVRKIK